MITADRLSLLTPTSTVPYITRWSRERILSPRLVIRSNPSGHGIGYAEEGAGDRDAQGVLWRRTVLLPASRRGRPLFGDVHARRQRRCAMRHLCQVCGGPASRTRDGILWLVERDPATWTRGIYETYHPPVCLPCADRSVRACPHLRDSVVYPVRVPEPQPVGVIGQLCTYNGATGQFDLTPGEAAFTSHRRLSIIAEQVITKLSHATPIDLQQELRRG